MPCIIVICSRKRHLINFYPISLSLQESENEGRGDRMARQKSTSGIIIILIEKGLTCISQEKKIIYRSFALSLFHHVALFYPVIQQSKNVRWTRSNNITVSAAAKAKPPLLPPASPSPIPPVDSSLTNQLTLPHTSNSIHTRRWIERLDDG